MGVEVGRCGGCFTYLEPVDGREYAFHAVEQRRGAVVTSAEYHFGETHLLGSRLALDPFLQVAMEGRIPWVPDPSHISYNKLAV